MTTYLGTSAGSAESEERIRQAKRHRSAIRIRTTIWSSACLAVAGIAAAYILAPWI